MLRPVGATILFFRKNRLHIATIDDIYEIQMQSPDNERGIKTTSVKTHKCQPKNNNNINTGLKAIRLRNTS